MRCDAARSLSPANVSRRPSALALLLPAVNIRPYRFFTSRFIVNTVVAAAMVSVFGWSVATLIHTSGPVIQITSSEIPSVADVEDWLLWRSHRMH